MCDCMKEMNAKLAERNGVIATAFQITEELGVRHRLLVGVEKIDKKKRKPVPVVAAACCPFCGEKYDTPAA